MQILKSKFGLELLVTIFLLITLVGSAYGQTQKPQAGGSISVAIPSEPPGLDPTTNSASSIDRIVYNNIYQGLVRINRKGEIVPCLATEWSISDDRTTYTFQLREGVKFHDGTSFTSEDVLYTFQRLLDPYQPIPHEEYYEVIKNLEAVGPSEIKFELTEPSTRFLFDLARGDSVILPEGSSDPANNPVGTGPFQLENWERGYSVTLTAFPNYYEDSLPYLEKVQFRFISDPNSMVSALRAGDIDVIGYGLPPESAQRLVEGERYKILEGLTTTDVILAMNNRREPFTDVRVRQAIAYAVDRNEIIQGALFGYGQPIGSHMSPLNPNYADLTWVRPHNLTKAKQLLQEAGYPDGFSATLKLPTAYRYAVRSGQIVAEQLEEIGLKVKIQEIDMGRWLSEVFSGGNYDLTIIGHAEVFDIGIYANPQYYFGYNNPEFREVMNQAKKAKRDEQAGLYGIAQWILAKDNPVAFLYELPSLAAMRKEVMGWWENYPTIANDVSRVWLKTDT